MIGILHSGSKPEITEPRCNCFSYGPPKKFETETASMSVIEIGLSSIALYIALYASSGRVLFKTPNFVRPMPVIYIVIIYQG